MKNILLILILFLSFQGFSQIKKDSISYLITKGITNSSLSLIPIVSGIAVIVDGENTKMRTQSYVFFGVGLVINLESVLLFRRAKYLSKHKL